MSAIQTGTTKQATIVPPFNDKHRWPPHHHKKGTRTKARKRPMGTRVQYLNTMTMRNREEIISSRGVISPEVAYKKILRIVALKILIQLELESGKMRLIL